MRWTASRAYLRPNRFPHLLKNKIQNFPTDLRGASQPLARLFWGGKWRSKGYFGAKKGVWQHAILRLAAWILEQFPFLSSSLLLILSNLSINLSDDFKSPYDHESSLILVILIILIILIISTQAGFSADGAGGSGLPAEGTWALSRALTQRTSQKIVFSIHQGSGGWGPSLLATDLVFDPFLIDHFLLLTSK